jgi:hypothetical protein
MATRTIVTSQPDVACDVCERRLLRGEQPDVFLAAGRRRTVCELCAPRAMHEGWLRETDRHSVSLPPLRPRRGRNLFERLRQVGKPAGDSAEVAATSPTHGREPAGYDFLDGFSGVADEPLGAPVLEGSDTGQPSAPTAGEAPDGGEAADVGEAVAAGDGRAERAIEAFNAGEYPRRVAGVARSLGAPGVSVRPDEDVDGLVSIVIAWELCWYHYEVHIGDQDATVRVLAQGTELGEIAHEDRLVNAVVDELGALSLSSAQSPEG